VGAEARRAAAKSAMTVGFMISPRMMIAGVQHPAAEAVPSNVARVISIH
jgi:hypothetical protein